MNFSILYQNLTFTTFVLFTFFSIVQLNYRHKLQINYFLAGAFFSTGLCFLFYWSFSLGLLKHAPFLIYMEIPFSFLAAPFFYLYFSTITGAKNYKTSSILLHSIPFILSFFMIIILNITDPSIAHSYISNPRIFPDYSVNKFILAINTVCDAFVTAYIFGGLYNISILFRSGKISREIIYVFIILVIFFISGLMLFMANILKMDSLTLIGLLFFIVLPAYHMIFSFRYPEFAIRVIKEGRSIRYKISISKKQDNSLIETRIIQLMEDDKIFTSADLTLESMAETLMIPHRKLSKIINSRFQKNFNTFVNSYRINEAKELLRLEPDKSVVEIAFLCGFNSTSSFYTYFERETNESPRDYRARQRYNY